MTSECMPYSHPTPSQGFLKSVVSQLFLKLLDVCIWDGDLKRGGRHSSLSKLLCQIDFLIALCKVGNIDYSMPLTRLSLVSPQHAM